MQGMEEHKNLGDFVFGQLGRPHLVVQNLYYLKCTCFFHLLLITLPSLQ